MTIRKRLLSGVWVGSLLFAAAAGIEIHALYGASRRVGAVTAVARSSDVADCAHDLSQSLGDLVEARYAGDEARHAHVNGIIADRFVAMDKALMRFEHAEPERGRSRTVSAMKNQAAELQKNWRQLQEVRPGDHDWPRALRLDDDASALLHTATSKQIATVRETGESLRHATNFIEWVIRSSITIALLLVIAVLTGGIFFASRLGTRLDRIRNRAKAIGAGDLSTTLEVRGDDEIDQIAVSFNDMVKALRSSRQQLEHDSLHDSLTGLPNRALFKERLGRRLAEAKRHEDYNFAVLFLDLDHFKLVNDSFGHAAGDELLRAVSTRLQQVVRDHELETGGENTLSRLGGDEFTILLEHVQSIEDAVAVAEAVKVSLAIPMQIEGHELTITSSVGLAFASADIVEAKTLMSDADAALYRTKAKGRNGYAIFDAGMRNDVVQRLRLENDLRRALDRGEFVLHFQPIFDLTGGHLTGFESLIRWARSGELVRPDLFIPIAEESGQIVEIGEWVIENACRQFQQWRTAHAAPLMLTLNVSRRQLFDPNLVPHLRKVLDQTGVEPSSLVIEITESMLAEAGPTLDTLAAIRALGVLVYIDDFGTGYSTLSVLHNLPIDGIKIDRSFVTKGDMDRDQLAVLNTVVQLAHTLDIPVVAEGIETPEQVLMLQSIECDRGQGFHFAKPLTSADAERLIVASANRKPQAA